jgi:hypothetical protein
MFTPPDALTLPSAPRPTAPPPRRRLPAATLAVTGLLALAALLGPALHAGQPEANAAAAAASRAAAPAAAQTAGDAAAATTGSPTPASPTATATTPPVAPPAAQLAAQLATPSAAQPTAPSAAQSAASPSTPPSAVPPPAAPAEPPLVQLQRTAAAAHQRGDFAAFHQAAAAAVELLPDSPRLLYNLACAQALTGQPDAALASLRRVVAMGAALPIAADPDLASLRDRTEFRDLVAAIAELAETPVGTASGRLALTELPGDFVPEAVAVAPNGDLLVSSVRQRRIVRVTPEGTLRDFVPSGQHGLLSALGLQVDARRGWLWACSSGLAETAGITPAELGTAAVLAFDLATGAPRARIELPAGRERACNDLALLADGRLLISDPVAAEVLVGGPESGVARTLAAGPGLRAPQAIVPQADGRTAWLADWSRGLFLLDLASGAVRRVPAPDGTTLVGIDGMIRHGNALYAVQNGLAPNRVVALRLDRDGSAVTGVEVLLRNHPDFDEPTLLTVRETAGRSELLVVANSHWNRFGRDGQLPAADTLTPPILLALPLSTAVASATGR